VRAITGMRPYRQRSRIRMMSRIDKGAWACIRGVVAKDPEGWLGNLDSNQDKQSQSLLCYRYTIPQGIVEQFQYVIEMPGNRAAKLPMACSRSRRSTR
jgi:hypothetical protein